MVVEAIKYQTTLSWKNPIDVKWDVKCTSKPFHHQYHVQHY